MGFINSFLGGVDIRQTYQFDFLVMSDDMIEEIKKVIKKLLIRGEKIGEEEYGSSSKDYIKDAKNGIILFKTGEKKYSADCYELYYMMEYNNEMWKVINRRTINSDGFETSIVNVVLIPEKLSSPGGGDRSAREVAEEAVNFYENETHLVSGEMNRSFYQLLMEDDLYRKLIENNNKNQGAIMSPIISKGVRIEEEKYDLPMLMIANEQEVNRLFGDVSKKIVGKERQTNLKFDPKIYTKSKEGVVVARLFSDEDGKSYADSEGSISMKRYYVLSDGLGMAKISTMEKPFKKEVVIMGITTYGQIQLNEDAIKRSATAAINSLMSINYDEINVSVYRDCTYEVMKETRWL